MKKILLLCAALILVAAPSLAAVGPEAPNPLNRPLRLDVAKSRGNGHTVWARTTYVERQAGLTGWDHGGRAGYSCGFMEWVEGNGTSTLADDVVLFKSVVEHYGSGGKTGPGDIDSDGLYAFVDTPGLVAGDEECSEIGTLAAPSGASATPAASEEELSRSTSPGEPSHAAGHILQAWYDTNGSAPGGLEEIVGARIQTPHAEDEFTWDPLGPGGGITSWWFRGDEDGEILLWYVNDDFNPAPYGIVARLAFEPMVPDVVVDDCVIGNPQGTPCPQSIPNEPPPPPPVTQVTLGSGTTELSCPDDSNPVATQVDPLQVFCA